MNAEHVCDVRDVFCAFGSEQSWRRAGLLLVSFTASLRAS